MRPSIKLQPNTPLTLTLLNPEGELDERYELVHYQTSSGTLTLSWRQAAKLNILELQAGEQFTICKHLRDHGAEYVICMAPATEKQRAAEEAASAPFESALMRELALPEEVLAGAQQAAADHFVEKLVNKLVGPAFPTQPITQRLENGPEPCRHTGTHPVYEHTCDDHNCWCHAITCQSKRFQNGEKCDCGREARSDPFESALMRRLSANLPPEQTIAPPELIDAMRRPWRSGDGGCPFCKQNNCEHWTGSGWKNPAIEPRAAAPAVPAKAPRPTGTPYRQALKHINQTVVEVLKASGEQWSSEAKQDLVSTLFIAAAKSKQIAFDFTEGERLP